MTAVAAKIPHFTLNNGVKVPSVGMGCWMGQPGGGEIVEEMCKNALKVGYRHFDTAFGYGNEEHVGKAIRESKIPREEIFVTTKLTNKHHHCVKEGLEMSLRNLGLDYIDLYLMHWPQAEIDDRVLDPDEHPTFIDTWKDMEKLLESGKVRAIGVSNFSIKLLDKLLPQCTVVPATNQVQLHPCLPQSELKIYCEDHGIILTAYSPFGQYNPLFFTDSDFLHIASRHEATPAQIAISWAVQRGTIVIPKSSNFERMKQNISLVTLTEEEMETINLLHKKPGMHRSLLTHYAAEGRIFGWTYEQLGWPLGHDGRVIESATD
ncbi:unnamed protein product [Somion occarium]